jgi:hypothetical protein
MDLHEKFMISCRQSCGKALSGDKKKVSHFSIIEITHLPGALSFFPFHFLLFLSDFPLVSRACRCLITDIAAIDSAMSTKTFPPPHPRPAFFISTSFDASPPPLAFRAAIIYDFITHRSRSRSRGGKSFSCFLTVRNKCSHVDEEHHFLVLHPIGEDVECN